MLIVAYWTDRNRLLQYMVICFKTLYSNWLHVRVQHTPISKQITCLGASVVQLWQQSLLLLCSDPTLYSIITLETSVSQVTLLINLQRIEPVPIYGVLICLWATVILIEIPTFTFDPPILFISQMTYLSALPGSLYCW